MSQADIIDFLNQVLGRKLYSMPAYIISSSPYIEQRDTALWNKLNDIVRENDVWARRIANAIHQLEGVAAPGMRDHSVATLNYLALSFLTTQIVDSLADDLGFIRSGNPLLNVDPGVRQLIEDLIKRDEESFEEVKKLADAIQQDVEQKLEELQRKRDEERRRKQEEERRRKQEEEQRAKEEKARKAAERKAAAAKAAAEKKAAEENKPAAEDKPAATDAQPAADNKPENNDAPSSSDLNES